MPERNLMLRSDRLASVAASRGKYAAAAHDRLASAVRGRKRSLLYVGTALALAGAGSASAATVGGSAPAPPPSLATTGPVSHVAAAASAQKAVRTSTGRPAAAHAATGRPAGNHVRVRNWKQVRDTLNRETNPAAARHGKLPLADRLTPVGTSGPQIWMPLSPRQLENATTIVRRALVRKMGVRSAVIAVATAMQESQLLNLNYGDLDSLGLFQQRPSMGWGTATQITHPAFAADAFLRALRAHQAGDPYWARQPLWASAQAVQKSGFPLAYARWESQAALLVRHIATRLL
jgi:hypothetical protein